MGLWDNGTVDRVSRRPMVLLSYGPMVLCSYRPAIHCFKLGRGDVVEGLAELAAERVGPAGVSRISVALGSRVEPVERKASCNRVL